MKKPRPAFRLSLEEREGSREVSAPWTLTCFAVELGRSVSTISREVGRNSGLDGHRAVRADRLAVARTSRPRQGKLAADDRLRTHVEAKLGLCWSPQQISRRLALEFPHVVRMRVSHETIYTSLFVGTSRAQSRSHREAADPAGSSPSQASGRIHREVVTDP